MQSLKKFESKKLSTSAARDVMGESARWCGTPQSNANYVPIWNGYFSGLSCPIATENCTITYNYANWLFPNGSHYNGNVRITDGGLTAKCYWEYLDDDDDFDCSGSLIWC